MTKATSEKIAIKKDLSNNNHPNKTTRYEIIDESGNTWYVLKDFLNVDNIKDKTLNDFKEISGPNNQKEYISNDCYQQIQQISTKKNDYIITATDYNILKPTIQADYKNFSYRDKYLYAHHSFNWAFKDYHRFLNTCNNGNNGNILNTMRLFLKEKKIQYQDDQYITECYVRYQQLNLFREITEKEKGNPIYNLDKIVDQYAPDLKTILTDSSSKYKEFEGKDDLEKIIKTSWQDYYWSYTNYKSTPLIYVTAILYLSPYRDNTITIFSKAINYAFSYDTTHRYVIQLAACLLLTMFYKDYQKKFLEQYKKYLPVCLPINAALNSGSIYDGIDNTIKIGLPLFAVPALYNYALKNNTTIKKVNGLIPYEGLTFLATIAIAANPLQAIIFVTNHLPKVINNIKPIIDNIINPIIECISKIEISKPIIEYILNDTKESPTTTGQMLEYNKQQTNQIEPNSGYMMTSMCVMAGVAFLCYKYYHPANSTSQSGSQPPTNTTKQSKNYHYSINTLKGKCALILLIASSVSFVLSTLKVVNGKEVGVDNRFDEEFDNIAKEEGFDNTPYNNVDLCEPSYTLIGNGSLNVFSLEQ